jgi:hypothetical protein
LIDFFEKWQKIVAWRQNGGLDKDQMQYCREDNGDEPIMKSPGSFHDIELFQ